MGTSSTQIALPGCECINARSPPDAQTSSRTLSPDSEYDLMNLQTVSALILAHLVMLVHHPGLKGTVQDRGCYSSQKPAQHQDVEVVKVLSNTND